MPRAPEIPDAAYRDRKAQHRRYSSNPAPRRRMRDIDVKAEKRGKAPEPQRKKRSSYCQRCDRGRPIFAEMFRPVCLRKFVRHVPSSEASIAPNHALANLPTFEPAFYV